MRFLQFLRLLNLFGLMYFTTDCAFYNSSELWVLIPIVVVLFDFFVMDWRIFRIFNKPIRIPKLRRKEEVNLFTDIFER